VLSIAYHLLDAEHMLHVVGDLVRDDVCFRKIARSSEAAVQFFEEGQSRYTF
jgi:hypothetical protein